MTMQKDPITEVHDKVKAHEEALQLAESYGFSSVLQAVTTAGQYIKGQSPDVPPSKPLFTQHELKMLALSLSFSGQIVNGGQPLPPTKEIMLLEREQFHALTLKLVVLCGIELPPKPVPVQPPLPRSQLTPPTTYDVTITFDDGVFKGRATTTSAESAYVLVLQDARMASAMSPQFNGKVLGWDAKPV
jgi:hypothetical protein